MAFQRDFVFVSGLDKSYSSRKRALVRRKVHSNQSLSSDQRLQLVRQGWQNPTQQRPSPTAAGTSTSDEELESELEGDLERVARESRCVSTVVDNVMSFDPFGSTANIKAGDSMFDDAHTHAILFRETMHDEACLAGMQAYAAYDLSRLGQCPPQFALAKRIRSISLINDAVQDPTRAYRDETLAAILGAIAVDLQPASAAIRAAHRTEAGVHIRGLARLVAGRGGPAHLPPWAQVFWFWQVERPTNCAAQLTFVHRMDVQTGGMLSAATHCLEEHQFRSVEQNLQSFHDLCRGELSDLYTTAYNNAVIRRQDLRSSLGEHFAPETNFCSLLSKGAAGRPTVRISALLYANIILFDCNSDIDAVHARLKKSTLLARLLETGKGTTEALLFALLTTDRACGGHMIENPTRTATLARCMYAYNRLTRRLQMQVENASMNLLLADPASEETVWEPARLRHAMLEDVEHPRTVSLDG
ncbi:hypothetical protein LTS10_003958 [Elasticomyces elasticus]|nr:hypothetical protein LTS10_003958 [Elasticomyces elasticus]